MRAVEVVLVIFCSLYVSSSRAVGGDPDQKTIYLLSILSYPIPDPSLNPSWSGGHNIQPVLELAKDQINNSPELLQNHTLELIHAEGGCDIIPLTMESLFRKVLHSNRTITGIIGPGCSSSTIRVAPVLNHTDLSLVIVHGSGDPIFEDRTKYRFAFGTVGSTENFARAFVHLIELANWTKVGILVDDTRAFYRSTKKRFRELLGQNVSVELDSPVSLMYIPLSSIKESLRVVFVFSPIGLAAKIMCLAYHNELYYDNYQWIFMGRKVQELFEPQDFIYEGMRYTCTEEDMTRAFNGSFFTIYRLIPNRDTPLISNVSYFEYLRQYEMYRDVYTKTQNQPSDDSHWSTIFYDAVWAWAKVLDALTMRGDLDVTKLDYSNVTQTEMIANQFNVTSFQGMSGEISFEGTGSPQPVVNLTQFFNDSESEEVVVAFIAEDRVEKKTRPEVIADSFDIKIASEELAVGILFILIALLQLTIIVVLHVFTARNSDKPSIKASNIKMLHVSYAGTYVLVAVMLLYSLKSIFAEVKCWFTLVTWAWLFPIGFTLAFGPVAMRTWRLYRIFQHYLNPGPFISNFALFGTIIFLLVVDTSIALVWTIVDPFKPDNDSQFISGSIVSKTDCVCEYYDLWFTMVLTGKLLLLLVVVILAFLTRNIPNRSFATNVLQVLSYITAILFILGFSTHFIVSSFSFDPNDKFVVFLCVLCLLVTVFILCIFVPPLSPILTRGHQSKWTPQNEPKKVRFLGSLKLS